MKTLKKFRVSFHDMKARAEYGGNESWVDFAVEGLEDIVPAVLEYMAINATKVGAFRSIEAADEIQIYQKPGTGVKPDAEGAL